jgi:hypothetical protein
MQVGAMSLVCRIFYKKFTRQNITIKGSGAGNLAGNNDVMSHMLWTRYFLEEQLHASSTRTSIAQCLSEIMTMPIVSDIREIVKVKNEIQKMLKW